MINVITKKAVWHKKLTQTGRVFLALLLLSFTSSTVSAQILSSYCDGLTSDWNNFLTTYPIHGYKLDPANAVNNTDDQFTGGSKDGQNVSQWNWSPGSANAKGDITNAAVVLTGTNNCILRFAADRTSDNGDASIGFWLFKSTISLNQNGTFSGVHTNGDLLILSDFTSGGTQPTITIYEWLNGSLTQLSSSTARCANVNHTTQSVPTGFTYTASNGATNYAPNLFFEGAIDLCALNLSTCFATFLVETRNSQSITASLQDFALGSFNATPSAPTAVNNSRCGPGTVTLTPTGCSGGTIQWYATSTSTTTLATGPSYTTPSLTATTTYYISCKVGTCESGRVPIQATIKPVPTINLIVVNPTLCGSSTGSLEVCSPVTGAKYTLGSTDITAQSGQPVKFTGLAAGSNPSVTITATNGCTATANCSSATATCPSTPSVQAAPTKSTMALVEEAPETSTVTAAPNPFNDRIQFSITPSTSGRASLDLYNLMGQKVKTVFQGQVQKGQVQTIEYSVPYSQRSMLLYQFNVGKERVAGKLIGLN